MSTIMDLFGRLSPLRKDKSPGAAAILGFLFGGVGLGLYFWSFIDFLFPVVIALIVGIAAQSLKGGGWLIGAILAGTYGYFRAQQSNAARAKAAHPATPDNSGPQEFVGDQVAMVFTDGTVTTKAGIWAHSCTCNRPSEPGFTHRVGAPCIQIASQQAPHG